MENKGITAIIGIVVAIMVTASALIPVISDAGKGDEIVYTNTFNEAGYRLSQSDGETPIEIHYLRSTDTLTLNGNVITPTPNVTLNTVFATDNIVVTWDKKTTSTYGTVLFIREDGTVGNIIFTNSAFLDLVCDKNGITVTDGLTSGELSAPSYIFYTDSNGTYAQVLPSENPFVVKEVNDILTTSRVSNRLITVQDGIAKINGTVVQMDIVADPIPEGGVRITLLDTWEGSAKRQPVVFVPIEVVFTLEPDNPTLVRMLNLIPLIVIMGIILVAANAIRTRD
jgi:hypothetical protein